MIGKQMQARGSTKIPGKHYGPFWARTFTLRLEKLSLVWRAAQFKAVNSSTSKAGFEVEAVDQGKGYCNLF